MTISRRLGVALAFACALFSAPAQAETYPDRPIRLVVPFPPGGASDVVGRLLADQMKEELGQNVIVDNRGGASGNIGSDIVAKAPGDGYTLLLASVSSHAVNPHLFRQLPFDPAKDFTPISLIVMVPTVLVVPSSLPARTMMEFVALAKARPGKLNFGSVGNGTTQHLAGEMLKLRTGIDMVHVPYRGQNVMVPDLVTGQIHAVFNNVAAVVSFLKSGELRALGVALPERWPTLPEVPTFTEAGFADFEVSSWLALFGPAGVPKPIVEKLAAAGAAAVRDPETREKLIGTGTYPVGGTPAELAEFRAAESKRWGDVVRHVGVSLD